MTGLGSCHIPNETHPRYPLYIIEANILATLQIPAIDYHCFGDKCDVLNIYIDWGSLASQTEVVFQHKLTLVLNRVYKYLTMHWIFHVNLGVKTCPIRKIRSKIG